jgi:hypothetical protein
MGKTHAKPVRLNSDGGAIEEDDEDLHTYRRQSDRDSGGNCHCLVGSVHVLLDGLR